MIGLSQIIVGSGRHSLHHFCDSLSGCEEDDISCYFPGRLTQPAADFRSLHRGHHPIENGKMRRIVFLQSMPGFEAVADGNDLVSPIGKVRRQYMTGNRIILGD